MDGWVELTDGRWVNLASAISITFEPTARTLRILYPVMGMVSDEETLPMMGNQSSLWSLRLDGRDAQIIEEHFHNRSRGSS